MRILVVEDEKDICDFLKKSLESECYVVDTAADGEAGIEMIRGNNYDIVILDNNMPKKTGLEVCKEVRAEKNNIPILMLSVQSETTTKVDLLNAGADDYLTKPFSLDELQARVKALLRRPKVIEEEILKIDDLSLDIDRHVVRRDKKEISLTKKEFTLLAYLLKNIGIVLSRSMIMEHVWDMNVDPFSNTIESHIMSLRKKIDLPKHKKLIRTVSGRGYKIDVSA
ncbi:response regulator transcription factor [Candidatus Parcubacteria bacterium]|nr:response regulator transcription factor [Candidatus Parcubacteria bacterium]